MPTTPILARIMAALALVGGAVVASGGAAQAVAENCSATTLSVKSASSICTSGTGEHRVVVWALHEIWGATQGAYQYGPWVQAGQTSLLVIDGPYAIPAWSAPSVETR